MSMLRRCAKHDFDDLALIKISRNGLLQQPKLLLNATAIDSLMAKIAKDAITIIERMTLGEHQGQYIIGASQIKKNVGVKYK